MVDRRVLIPRPETEVVAERALVELRRLGLDGPPVAVDLGTGSGAIGLSLAREYASADVWITDVSSDALDVARANVAGLGRHGSRVRAVEGSWFEPLPIELAGRISLVVSNPPYVSVGDDLPASVVDWEPRHVLIAESDGYAAYDVLIGESPDGSAAVVPSFSNARRIRSTGWCGGPAVNSARSRRSKTCRVEDGGRRPECRTRPAPSVPDR